MSAFKLPAHIAWRYVYARRGSRFISLNAILAILGITIGIAALIVVLSVMNGVVSEVRNKMLSMTAHVSIRPVAHLHMESEPSAPIDQFLQGIEGIEGWAPNVVGQGLIGDNNAFVGVIIQGIDPRYEVNVSEMYRELPEEQQKILQAGSFNILLGEGLAQRLNLAIGDKMTIVVPSFSRTAAGLMPRLKRFTYQGSFQSGHYQFDNQLVLVHLEDAAKLLRFPEGTLSSYRIRLHDPFQADRVRQAINQRLPSAYYASDWSLDNSAYFSAVRMEKNAMFIILCLIIIVAAFGLLSSMYMVINEKRRDIAILRTLGLNRARILLIFLLQGMIFGIFGMICGVLSGIIITLNVPNIMDFLERNAGFSLPPEMYFINELPARIDPGIVFNVCLFTLVLTLIFSLIPATLAALQQPARALSYE